MGILYKEIEIISMDEAKDEVFTGDVLIEGKYITKIGDNISIEGHEVIDGKKKLLMPGFINSHNHMPMSIFRSYADDMYLFDWLSKKIWPVEDHITKEDIYIGAKFSMAEMIRSGTTSSIDMYMEMDSVARAGMESGLRVVISKGTTSSDNSMENEKSLEDIRLLHKKYHGACDGRITFMLAPHAIYTNSREFLKKQIELAKELGVGIHIHVSETVEEVENSIKENALTPVAYLESIGMFDLKVVAAHCVHLTDEDIEILKKYNVGIVHNPKSNLKLASGIAPIQKYQDRGLLVALGTDGVASNNKMDMLEELQYASLLQKGAYGNPLALKAYNALKLATINGAKVLGIDDKVGMIREGMEADLIVMDLDSINFYPSHHSIVSKIVYAANSRDISHTMVQGKFLMKDQELITLDVNDLKNKLDETTVNLLKRSGKYYE